MNFKAEVSDHCVSVSGACSTTELCTVITVIVNGLYETMPTDADKFEFKMALKTAFASDLPFASEEERHEIMLKKLENIDEELKKAIKEVKSESSSDEDDLQ